MAVERLDIIVSSRGTRRVSRNIEKIGTSARAAQGGVSLLRSALGALSGALILRSAIKTLADFGQSMSTIKAITGEVGNAFTEMRDRAKELGIQTRFSATQAAEGMVFLARTGFSANEVLKTIQGTLDLAQVGLLDVARAADIASNVLKGFRLEADDMGRVIDVLALTSSKANTNIEQLGDAMSFAAPAAAALGISVETTAAAIGVLSDAGIQGTRAGSGLRTTLIKLLSPTGEARDVILDLGLNVEDLNVKSRGLIPVLETLATKETELRDAAKLAGIRQAANLLILIEALPKLKELAELNEKATGTARRMATVMDDNLNGALLRVKSAFEGVTLAIGDFGATGFIRNFMEGLASSLRLVAANIENVLNGFQVLAVGFVFTKLRAAISGLIALMLRLNLAIAANPFGALAIALTAATASLVTFGKEVVINTKYAVTFTDAWEAAGTTLSDTVSKALKDVGIDFINWNEIVQVVINTLGKSFLLLVGLFNSGLKTISLTLDGIILLNKRATLLLVQGLNAMAEAFNATLGRIGAEKLELIDETALEKDIARLAILLGNAGNEIAEAFKAPMREAFRIADQRQLLEFFNKNVLRKPDRKDKLDDDDSVKKLQKPIPIPRGFKNMLRDLRREGELLLLNNKQRAIREALFAAEEALEKKLSPVQEALIQTLAGNNFELARQVELLEKIRDPQKAYMQGLNDINKLLKDNRINTEEAANATRDLRLAFLETQTDAISGFERAFLKMGKDVEDFATSTERLLTDAFKGAEDALVEFVTTGKLSFRSLVDSILKDLARMAIRANITGPLIDFFGGVFKNVLNPATPPINPGAIQIATASHGGLLRGAGSGTSDSIPTLLSHGEFVTNANDTARFLPLLQAINNFSGSGGGGGGSRGGGTVVQIIDQRGSQAAPVERQERTGANGTKTISLIIRDTVRRQVSSGQFDQSFQSRFGLSPALR